MKFNSNLFEKFESSRLKETYLILGGRQITHHSSDGHCDEIRSDGKEYATDCGCDSHPAASWN